MEDLRHLVEELLRQSRAPSTLWTYKWWCSDFDKFVAAMPGVDSSLLLEKVVLFMVELH